MMKTASGQASLKWYRTNFDQFALKRLEQELHKTYQVPENKKILDFERKTKENKTIQTGLSMEQLKAQHQEIADHQKEVQTKTLNDQNSDVQAQVKTITKNLKDIYEATTGRQAVDKDGYDLSPLEMAKGIKKANRAAQDDKEKTEKAAANAEQERQKAEQQKSQQEQQLATQRQQLKALQDQLDEANNQPINVTEDNVAQNELEQINQQLLKAHSTKANLESTNQELTRQNT